MQRSGVLVSSPKIVTIVCKTITFGMYDQQKIVKVLIFEGKHPNQLERQ